MSDIGFSVDGFALLLLFASVALAFIGGFGSWFIIRSIWGPVRDRIWIGVWATLPEMMMVTVAWLAVAEPGDTFAVAGFSVPVLLFGGAIQCVRAEIGRLRGHPRRVVWMMGSHAFVLASVCVFVLAGWLDRAPISSTAAIACGILALWGIWPLRDATPPPRKGLKNDDGLGA